MTVRRRIRRARFPYNLQEFQRELQRIGGDNLVAYWPLDDQSGVRARDLLESLGSGLLSNGGFETAGTGDPDFWANWTESVSDGALANETTLVYHGADAAKITAGSSTDTHIYQDITTVAGDYYKLVLLTRGDGTHAGRYQIYDNDNGADIVATTATGVTGTNYTAVAVYFNSPAGCTSVRIYCHCPSTDTGIAYFDDVSVREVLAGEYLDITGCTLGQKGPPQLGRSHYFDGINDVDSQHSFDDETGSSWGPTVHGLSLIDGNAFIRVEGVDLSTFAGTEGSDTPYMIVLTDDAGSKVAWGMIGAADAAESTIEKITNGDNESAAATLDDDVSVDAAYAQSGDEAHGGSQSAKVTSLVNGNFFHLFIDDPLSQLEAGALYKVSLWIYIPGGQTMTNVYIDLDDGGGYTAAQAFTDTDTWLEYTTYSIVPETRLKLRIRGTAGAIGDKFYIDDISLKEVTHVGTDAVHIVSTKDGSTRNWADIEAGFDYNDSAYTFEVRKTLFQITGALTIGVWVKPAAATIAGAQVLLSKWEGATYKSFVLYRAANEKYCFLTSSDGSTDDTDISGIVRQDTDWHLVMATFSPGSISTLYVDGAVEGTDGSPGAALFDTFLPVALGVSYDSSYTIELLLNGNLAHAFICDFAMSSAQAHRLYDIGRRAHSG